VLEGWAGRVSSTRRHIAASTFSNRRSIPEVRGVGRLIPLLPSCGSNAQGSRRPSASPGLRWAFFCSGSAWCHRPALRLAKFTVTEGLHATQSHSRRTVCISRTIGARKFGPRRGVFFALSLTIGRRSIREQQCLQTPPGLLLEHRASAHVHYHAHVAGGRAPGSQRGFLRAVIMPRHSIRPLPCRLGAVPARVGRRESAPPPA
jgi:hypothetical protein